MNDPVFSIELRRDFIEVASQFRMIPSIYRVCAKIGVLQHSGVAGWGEIRNISNVVEKTPSGSGSLEPPSQQRDRFLVIGFR